MEWIGLPFTDYCLLNATGLAAMAFVSFVTFVVWIPGSDLLVAFWYSGVI